MGQLISLRVKANNTWINFVSVYAPPEGDNPDFFLTSKTKLEAMEGDLGLICGDFNTTLNPVIDQYGYTTEPHKNVEQLFINGLTMGNLLM